MADFDSLITFIVEAGKQNPNHKNVVLAIDEIHGLKKQLIVALLTLAEKKKLIQKDKQGNLINYVLDNPHRHRSFAFWGMTTNEERLFKPLRNRFLPVYFQLPVPADKHKFLSENNIYAAEREFRVFCDSTVSFRDMAQIIGVYRSLGGDLTKAMGLLGYDESGLSTKEREYLKYLKAYRTASIETIAACMSMDAKSAADIERNLIRKGKLTKSSAGRTVK